MPCVNGEWADRIAWGNTRPTSATPLGGFPAFLCAVSSLAPGGVEVIIKVYHSKLFYKTISRTLHQNVFLVSAGEPRWWYVNIGSGNDFDAVRLQAIAQNNVDPDLFHHMSSLGHNELYIFP